MYARSHHAHVAWLVDIFYFRRCFVAMYRFRLNFVTLKFILVFSIINVKEFEKFRVPDREMDMVHDLHGKHDHACDASRQTRDFQGGQQQVNLLDDGDHGAGKIKVTTKTKLAGCQICVPNMRTIV